MFPDRPTPASTSPAGGADPGVAHERSFALSCWSGCPDLMPRAHRHEDIEVNVVVRGELTYLIGGAAVVVAAGQTVAFWATIPHQMIARQQDSHLHWLTIPVPVFVGWDLPDALLTDLLATWVVRGSASTRAGHDDALFTQWADDLRSDDPERTSIACLEMQARLRRLALETAPAKRNTPVGRSSRYPGAATRHAAAIAAFLAQNFDRELSVFDVAAATHLHPHHAMAVFRQVMGTTIVGFRTQCRIAQAQRLLRTTDLPVSDIAHRVGFGSASRFYAAFSEGCGTSPGNYRRSSTPVGLPG